jgi:hypothetical protein
MSEIRDDAERAFDGFGLDFATIGVDVAGSIASAGFPSLAGGCQLLDDVHAFLKRFAVFPSAYAACAVVLWAVHTHMTNAFETSPRCAILSAELASGKTRVLELLELIVPRPVSAVNMSPSALFRLHGNIEAGTPTVLFDEVDTIFGPKARDQEDLRGLLNAGYRRGAKTYRSVITGGKVSVEEIEAFSAVALAGLGDLPDTLLSRSIIIRMRRRAPGETVESFRRRLHAGEGHALRDRLAAWALGAEPIASKAWPEMPDEITDRDADCWEPLLTVADLAGGHWPTTARVAAVALVAESRGKRESLGVRLLMDIRTAFDGSDQMPTALLLGALNGMEESPWGDLRGQPLNARTLSRMVGKYGVKPTTIRTGTGTPKGYRATDLFDAWQRYVPALPLGDENIKTSATRATCERCAGVGCQWCAR